MNMQVATPRKLVLPPIGPLFAVGRSFMLDTSDHHHQQHQQYHHVPDFQHANLRTPTGVHALTSFDATFPTSSPVRKDGRKPLSCASMKDFAALDAFKLDASLSSPRGSASPTDVYSAAGLGSPLTGEDEEKLRLSRERNRLHAQRTRIRKRELLENLKDRIANLQGEYMLLKQAYDSHVTAMYLLSMCDESAHLSIQGLDDISDLSELHDLARVVCVNDEDVDAAAAASGQTSLILHDKNCPYYHMDPEDDGSGDEDVSCACMDRHSDAQSPLLNGNGKRPHSNSISLMTCSKEDREQVRRERNRLHARRARLRKKLMLEKSQQAVQTLRGRNELLRARLSMLVASIYDGRQPMLPPMLRA